jgi:hypothetical protein
MRIHQNISLQRSLKNFYWKEAQKALYKAASPVIEILDKVSIDEVKQRSKDLLKRDVMEKYILDLWVKTGGRFASDMTKKLRNRKSIENPDLEMWEEGFRVYMYERSQKIAHKVLTTEAEMINSILDRIVAEAEGQSIYNLSGAIKEQFLNEMVTIQNYEAERIARTEVIGASNKGSFDGAKSMGLQIRKGWSTSGLPGIRDSHLLYESFGWIDMDKEFAPGLMFPGDPNGEAGEIINCRCTIIYNTD